ncbi:hypothetical protein LguiB_029993 [Lonicera macranthoides]
MAEDTLRLPQRSKLEALDFAFRFFNNGTANSFFLVVLIILTLVNLNSTGFQFGYTYNCPPVVLWFANRDHSVEENTNLNLTGSGLVLGDENDATWAAKIHKQSTITHMELYHGGNLRLFNRNNAIVWQSFDNPTNTWLPRQHLHRGLFISTTSKSNLAKGLFYLSIQENAIRAFVNTRPSQLYRTCLRSADNSKRQCLTNCSCKAVIFRYDKDNSMGNCYFPLQIFSLRTKQRKIWVIMLLHSSRFRSLHSSYKYWCKISVVEKEALCRVKALEIAIWRLQPYSKRPSMPMGVKVLAGLMGMEPITHYSFLTMYNADSPLQVDSGSSTPLMASILSGPRNSVSTACLTDYPIQEYIQVQNNNDFLTLPESS